MKEKTMEEKVDLILSVLMRTYSKECYKVIVNKSESPSNYGRVYRMIPLTNTALELMFEGTINECKTWIELDNKNLITDDKEQAIVTGKHIL
jgi:hypothetical protein